MHWSQDPFFLFRCGTVQILFLEKWVHWYKCESSSQLAYQSHELPGGLIQLNDETHGCSIDDSFSKTLEILCDKELELSVSGVVLLFPTLTGTKTAKQTSENCGGVHALGA